MQAAIIVLAVDDSAPVLLSGCIAWVRSGEAWTLCDIPRCCIKGSSLLPVNFRTSYLFR
jgi:hypothetical protein